MDDLLDFTKMVVIPMLIIMGSIFILTNFHGQYACGKYEEVTGRETKWIFIDDCYVNSGDAWLKKDEYAATIIAREGLKAKGELNED